MTIAAAGYTAEDPLFTQPYIDVQEWRDSPVIHFYVHGGFAGTNTRFSYYFRMPGSTRAGSFSHVTPVP